MYSSSSSSTFRGEDFCPFIKKNPFPKPIEEIDLEKKKYLTRNERKKIPFGSSLYKNAFYSSLYALKGTVFLLKNPRFMKHLLIQNIFYLIFYVLSISINHLVTYSVMFSLFPSISSFTDVKYFKYYIPVYFTSFTIGIFSFAIEKTIGVFLHEGYQTSSYVIEHHLKGCSHNFKMCFKRKLKNQSTKDKNYELISYSLFLVAKEIAFFLSFLILILLSFVVLPLSPFFFIVFLLIFSFKIGLDSLENGVLTRKEKIRKNYFSIFAFSVKNFEKIAGFGFGRIILMSIPILNFINIFYNVIPATILYLHIEELKDQNEIIVSNVEL